MSWSGTYFNSTSLVTGWEQVLGAKADTEACEEVMANQERSSGSLEQGGGSWLVRVIEFLGILKVELVKIWSWMGWGGSEKDNHTDSRVFGLSNWRMELPLTEITRFWWEMIRSSVSGVLNLSCLLVIWMEHWWKYVVWSLGDWSRLEIWVCNMTCFLNLFLLLL